MPWTMKVVSRRMRIDIAATGGLTRSVEQGQGRGASGAMQSCSLGGLRLRATRAAVGGRAEVAISAESGPVKRTSDARRRRHLLVCRAARLLPSLSPCIWTRTLAADFPLTVSPNRSEYPSCLTDPPWGRGD